MAFIDVGLADVDEGSAQALDKCTHSLVTSCRPTQIAAPKETQAQCQEDGIESLPRDRRFAALVNLGNQSPK